MASIPAMVARMPNSPASGPKSPPVHNSGPCCCMLTNVVPCCILPLTGKPKKFPCTRFHVRCSPMGRASSPVSTKPSPNMKPMSVRFIVLTHVLYGLKRCSKPKITDEAIQAISTAGT